MSLQERKQQIIDLVSEHDGCSVTKLADALAVSEVTIRRDLQDLDEQGLIHRSHGGALPAAGFAEEKPYDEKQIRNLAAKKAIAEQAVEVIQDDQVVIFDGGTTTLQIAQAAPSDRSIIPVTISPLIAVELQRTYGEVKVSGGTLRSKSMTWVGPAAEEFLDRLTFNLLFLATGGISLERGLTSPNEGEARLKEIMIRNSRHVVLVADQTKFGTERFARFGRLSDVDRVITEGSIPTPIRQAFLDGGAQIVDELNIN